MYLNCVRPEIDSVKIMLVFWLQARRYNSSEETKERAEDWYERVIGPPFAISIILINHLATQWQYSAINTHKNIRMASQNKFEPLSIYAVFGIPTSRGGCFHDDPKSVRFQSAVQLNRRPLKRSDIAHINMDLTYTAVTGVPSEKEWLTKCLQQDGIGLKEQEAEKIFEYGTGETKGVIIKLERLLKTHDVSEDTIILMCNPYSISHYAYSLQLDYIIERLGCCSELAQLGICTTLLCAHNGILIVHSMGPSQIRLRGYENFKTQTQMGPGRMVYYSFVCLFAGAPTQPATRLPSAAASAVTFFKSVNSVKSVKSVKSITFSNAEIMHKSKWCRGRFSRKTSALHGCYYQTKYLEDRRVEPLHPAVPSLATELGNGSAK
ncbi:hypothetical protein DFH11DRAFT_1748163 [Phellopilus nigrolimitatus]|nr:hypothetical protein DFH11DRAFT_1748163 [Phellopilus nigrolimitatus]